MLDFKLTRDKKSGVLTLETSLNGKALLTIPQLNKGTAFSTEERKAFGLLGKLPYRIESLEEQVTRAYLQFCNYSTRMKQNIYLNNLHDKNQILFYKLINCYLGEMLPIIYTPIVGTAVQRYSHEYRQPRGLYIAHSDKNQIEEIIHNRTNPEIDLIVVTDGEGVLGIGDQGIGGMDIPVAKLMVYSLCGGIDPTRTLPVFLDVGTNNQALLDDPMYLGCPHPRIPQKDYDAFLKIFIDEIQKQFPNAFLHWEDLGRGNARRILDMYQDELCTFNDDIQGTGAVTLAALLAATEVTKLRLDEQRFIVFGAGSAGTGISDQIIDALIALGLSPKEAYQRFWLIDRQGLLLTTDDSLTDAQKPYARDPSELQTWDLTNPSLKETIEQVKPTVLIGCSAQPGAFTKDIIESMCTHCERPIIFPLSNPDDRCEIHPADAIAWSKGKALIASGTAFAPVQYEERLIHIAQCNNALVFPGIGLGIIAVAAKRLTKEMILAASTALCQFAPSKRDGFLPLLPSLDEAQVVAKAIALAVAQCAIESGQAQINQDADLKQLIEARFWQAKYLPYKRINLCESKS
ncbi:MAG: NAD-dependent malic enzyme [Legionella sp.]|nr:NAD-dependent malic enzyme [Legionella sp.]